MNPEAPNYIHAGPWHEVSELLCHWRFEAFGQHLRCDDTVLPGELECASHFIEAAHARDRRDRPFSSEWRRFPAVTLNPQTAPKEEQK